MTQSALQQICISMCLCCLLFMVPQSLTPMPHTRTHLRICILPCTTHTSRTTYMAHAIVPYLSLLLFSMHSSLFKTSWSTKIFPPWFLVLFIIEFPCTQILRIRIDSGLPQFSVCLCMCGNGFVCSGFFGGLHWWFRTPFLFPPPLPPIPRVELAGNQAHISAKESNLFLMK